MGKTAVAQEAKAANALPSSQRILQRKCACGNQTVADGKCADCGNKKYGLQRKLTIGASNDPLEREADRVADQVMAMGYSSVNEAPLHIQRYAGQASEGADTTTAPASVDRVLASSGRPLESALRQDMEQRFGHDFSQVRVHSDVAAEQSAREVNAYAYTAGNNIVFGTGQFAPKTYEGQRLIAHELTHVVQQKQISRTIQRQHTFTPGRPAHDHSPVGWATVQAGLSCSPLSERGRIECVCAAMSPVDVLTTVLFVEMHGMLRATAHLVHYISGGGTDLNEDANLDDLIRQDAAVRGKFATAIAASPTDNIPIWQGDYTVQDFRFAFGGIDRVDYEVDAAAGTVDIWFKDRYDFHPVGFGYINKGVGDSAPPGRITNCVHAAAVELKATGSAADYWMQGEATFPLSLFTSSGSTGSGSDDL